MTINELSSHIVDTHEECNRLGTAFALLYAMPICLSIVFNRQTTDEDKSLTGAAKPEKTENGDKHE